MHATELRIGNYIYWNHKGVPFNDYMWTHEVESIGKDDIWTKSGYTSINKIEPIPLTEDWLLRFGFDPENDLKHPDAPIYFCSIRGELICFLHNCSHRHIKHVHDLQNLFFSVKKEELTLKTE